MLAPSFLFLIVIVNVFLLAVQACGRNMSDGSLRFDVFSFSFFFLPTAILKSGHSVVSGYVEGMICV